MAVVEPMSNANPNCIFCKIIAGDIPCTKVYETDTVLAFEDINPVAPVHVLVIPKRCIQQADEFNTADRDLLGDIMLAAGEVARIKGVTESGYRLTTNNGPQGGQEVLHLHLHVLGGRQMGRMG